MPESLGELESLILFAVLRLDDGAYGVPIRREIASRTGREISAGAVYTTLQRLERRGLVSSRFGQPTPERGGKRKKFYQLQPAGARSLERSFEALRRMAEGTRSRLDALVSTGEVGDA